MKFGSVANMMPLKRDITYFAVLYAQAQAALASKDPVEIGHAAGIVGEEMATYKCYDFTWVALADLCTHLDVAPSTIISYKSLGPIQVPLLPPPIVDLFPELSDPKLLEAKKESVVAVVKSLQEPDAICLKSACRAPNIYKNSAAFAGWVSFECERGCKLNFHTWCTQYGSNGPDANAKIKCFIKACPGSC